MTFPSPRFLKFSFFGKMIQTNLYISSYLDTNRDTSWKIALNDPIEFILLIQKIKTVIETKVRQTEEMENDESRMKSRWKDHC